jgi:predicted nucleic acid-binding protein
MEDTMNKKIKRVYVDGCAVGMAFNPTFAAQTRPFWESVQRGEIIAIVSDVLERELQKAPSRARELVYGLSESQIERVISTEESNRLAGQYIAENVVDETSLDDCRHIALATINNADALVSWNFRHIVYRRAGYNDVNEKLGYPRIEIQTPEKFMEVHHDET